MTRRELRARAVRPGPTATPAAPEDFDPADDTQVLPRVESFDEADAPFEEARGSAALRDQVDEATLEETPVEGARLEAHADELLVEEAPVDDDEPVRESAADASVPPAPIRTWPAGLAFPSTQSWGRSTGSPFPPVRTPERQEGAWSSEHPEPSPPGDAGADLATGSDGATAEDVPTEGRDAVEDVPTEGREDVDEGMPDEESVDTAERPGTATAMSAAGELAAGDGAPSDQPGAWDLAVGWSLRHELPRELPPEPDDEDEDVHWGALETVPLPRVPAAPDEAEDAPGQTLADIAPDAPVAAPAVEPVDEPADELDEPVNPSAADPHRPQTTPADPSVATVAGPTGARSNHGPHDGPSAPLGSGELPTLQDLLAARPAAPDGPAEAGWQGTVRRLTSGLVAPAPGASERRHRSAVAVVQRSLEGPKTVVVINPKGGAHKTTATLLLAATFGQHRGGYTLAWDNNETRGTLGWRSRQSRHHNTAVNLLQDLERFSDPRAARVGDLDNYVRAQGSAQFDVLASDEDAASAASIDAFAFRSLHRTLSRFYRIMVIDTGNNMRASNWQAAIEAADQVVLVSTVREDTAQSAAWAVDALRATGHDDKVRQAITVLSAPAERVDGKLAARLHEHFGQLTREVLEVPYDPSLVAGRPLDISALAPRTREAWLTVTAAVAEGL